MILTPRRQGAGRKDVCFLCDLQLGVFALRLCHTQKEGVSMYSLRGKIIFITGASSGIGAACARAFAAQGAKVLLCARRSERVLALANELQKKHGVVAHAFQLDVRDQPAVESAIASLPPEWNAIEVLVNNAGLSRGLDKLHEGKLQDWEEMIDTNVKGFVSQLHMSALAL